MTRIFYHCGHRSYTSTILCVFVLNGILLIVFQESKQNNIPSKTSKHINPNSPTKVFFKDWNNRTKLSDAVIVSKSTDYLREILPPWEDIIEINEGIYSHHHAQTTEELTESILWKADQQERLRNGLKIEYNQQKELPRVEISPKYNFTIFTLNYNAGPVQAVRHLLEPWGVKFIDHSYSSYCKLIGTCVKNLQALNKENSFDPSRSLIDKFYEIYKHNEHFRDVDMFLCIDPPAICELFLPFNKSLFVLVGSRYELGHSSPAEWKMWNDKLKKIASNQRNIVATTNTYDAEYMRHFTQISPTILQYPCQYISSMYSNPQKVQYLLFPAANEAFRKYFMEQISLYSKEGPFNVSITYFKEDVTTNVFTPRTATDYQGMVLIPNDASSLTITEIYRMNIPLFVPTIQLLSRWHISFHVITWRTLVTSRNPRDQGSFVPSSTTSQMPDPNNEEDISAMSHWLQFLDIYMNPYAIIFSSFQDLLNKMESFRTNKKFENVSKNMRAINEHLKHKAKHKWKTVLDNVFRGKQRSEPEEYLKL